MINWLKAYVTDPALPSRLLDTLFVGLIIAGTLWMLQLFWRQIRSLPKYIATSRKQRRHQNYIEIRRRIENVEYLILVEEESKQVLFALLFLLVSTILLFVYRDATATEPLFATLDILPDLGFISAFLFMLSGVVIFAFYGGLLNRRNRAARLHRAGMRRNKKAGALERRRAARGVAKVHDSGVRHGRDPLPGDQISTGRTNPGARK